MAAAALWYVAGAGLLTLGVYVLRRYWRGQEVLDDWGKADRFFAAVVTTALGVACFAIGTYHLCK
jgi:hypothetical protein